MSERCFDGRVVVLTGGAGLLGRNHSVALSRAGAHVVVADMNAEAAHRVADSLSGAEGMAVQVDITSRGSVEQMIGLVVQRLQRIDALVNNAAIDPKFDRTNSGRHASSFEDYPLESWQLSLDVNLTGAFLCTQAAAPHLLASGHGSVVNVASIYGL